MFDISDYLSAHHIQAVRDTLKDRPEGELTIQIQECLKYLIIMSERDGGFVPVTQPVDDVWHELILQTPDYERLCLSLPGGGFIHHRNLTFGEYSRMKSQSEILDEFIGWIPAYVSRFGAFTAERAKYWAFCDFLMTSLGVGLDQLNHTGLTGSEGVA